MGHGLVGSRQAGELRAHNRRSLRGGSSRRAEEEQEVRTELRWSLNTVHSPLQEARGLPRGLGSGGFSAALKWSKSWVGLQHFCRAAVVQGSASSETRHSRQFPCCR